MAFNPDRPSKVWDEPHEIDDKLITQFCAGDEHALDILLQRYWSDLVRFASDYLQSVDAAEDVTQIAFIRLWEKRTTWNPSGSIGRYLYTSVRNLSLNEKDRRRVRKLWAQRQEGREGTVTTALDDMQAEETLRILRASIEALPARRREVFRLACLEGFSYQETAEILGVSVQTVANQMSSALKVLRRSIRSDPT